MSIRVALTHKTFYDYDRPVSLSPQIIRLRPAPHNKTKIVSYSLNIQPEEYFINWQQDPCANWMARLVFPEKVTKFHITVDLVADIDVYNPFDFFLEESAETMPFEYAKEQSEELAPYLQLLPDSDVVNDYFDKIDRTTEKTVDFLVQLNQQLQQDISYVIRMEPGVQTPEETLIKRSGSCRDSAWLLVAILRKLGMASRFVSGYLIQLKPDVKALEGPTGTDHDFTDLHAWAEVYLPGAGWIGLDPTSGLLAGEGHIPVAATPEPASAAPLAGGLDECEVSFSHDMQIQRILESPRVTKPYSDEQWEQIDKLGSEVDKRLQNQDIRLTMGGEPTFVAVDNMDAPEWTTGAVGHQKRERAERLIHRLREKIAPDGFLHFGQGKWYPGESLPRWALTLLWRKDGNPIMKHAAKSGKEADFPADPIDATEKLAKAFAEQLKINPECVVPAYEDPWHYLEAEQKLPIDVTAVDNELDDAEKRARLTTVFSRGLGKPKGFVLPVQRWNAAAGNMWFSEVWKFRQTKCFLLPGDSPVGLRLPFDSLPKVAAQYYPPGFDVDPFAPRDPLPQSFIQAEAEDSKDALQEQLLTSQPVAPKLENGYYTGKFVRTAICFEPKDDVLHVFMPPLHSLEDYLELVEYIEEVGQQMALPVVFEGYLPPHDNRVDLIKITPDPGVIEVNINPANDWQQLRDNTEMLYEEAHQVRLGTEKFDLDGRHVGTGGGNHIVVGGASPADSPFLRRPDLLGSIIRFWQNHPSLSYLFSGLFIGPTSQAPRVDEARDDVLYEMEVALSQLPKKGEDAPLWLVDRTLRHLLTDLTGNTHRSEICIDKLYSPDSSTGRLGLVEFRSFEMPPHARMSLTQQLLVRALIAMFWEAPYERPLVEWGHQLRDKMMLGHYLWEDMGDVLFELDQHGITFDREWFAPHFEFRFPHIGSVTYVGMTLDLRRALEPWHVLGEESGGSGTARYVDSSMERLQVSVSGFTPGRYIIACNGEQVPLQPTKVAGEYIAGVRFRAWQPPSCLHPSIGIHAPLKVEIIDTWSKRVVGGCTYHTVHPGGRNYDTFPVNSYEAEARRLARFEPFGHRPGQVSLPDTLVNPKFPSTLDLRFTSARRWR